MENNKKLESEKVKSEAKQNTLLSPEMIDLIVYDFDGVMTDNKVYLREDGLETVVVNRSDGLAVEILKGIGVKQVILTKERNKVVEARANKLKIPLIKGVDNKKDMLISFCEEHKILLDNVIYIGNDINDVEAMSIVGYPLCPLDAYEEVKELPKVVVLNARGGDGVVRELLNHVKITKEEV